MKTAAVLVPILPLLSFLIIGLNFKRLPKSLTSLLACGTVLVSFLISCALFWHLKETHASITVNLFDWITASASSIRFSFIIDPLSSLMLLVVTGVSFLIHIYSIGYMREDEGFNRFFAYLNLFVFSMLILVMGSNYLMMFIGWEGVGLCSYLLIGFWYKNTAYNNAARKAFIMNRIGDLGFLLGMFMLYIQFGTLDYQSVFTQSSLLPAGSTFITLATLFLFIGAIGKSAQIPLLTWLPDAMAGPTPVSALIHAATMVTAGIYMVARSHALYVLAPFTLSVIAIVGICTALLAASIAIYQNDIKKVLAYSTVSQLGYMFVGLGVGAFSGAMFHLTTHAFFKALLFMAAGSVIHAMSGEQDLRKMGGLRKALPVTFLVFLAGTIAISGIPPFSGFFSKDEILLHAYEQNKLIWALGVFGSMLTAFYMFRLFYLTFSSTFRGTEEQKHHLHESPKSMTIPLIILAILSIIGGLLNVPHIFGGNASLQEFLSPVLGSNAESTVTAISSSSEILLMCITVAGALIMILFAWYRFVKSSSVPVSDEAERNFLVRLLYRKYYLDELYTAIIVKPLGWLSVQFHRTDRLIIDGLVNSAGSLTLWIGLKIRLLQTGSIGFYLFAMVLGIIVFIFYAFLI